MKYILNFILLFLVTITLIGCLKHNTVQITTDELTTSTTKEIKIPLTISPTISIAQNPTNQTVEESETIKNTNMDEYQLCGLTINATEKQIIDKLGKPKHNLNYYLYDGVAWAELRCMMEYDGFTIRTGKQLKMTVDAEDSDYLLSEIDVFTPEYATYSGIKVGDSLDEVKKTYPNIQEFSINDSATSLDGNMIYNMLTRKDRPKLNGDAGYQADFDYGVYAKFAYIYYFDDKNPSSRSSLIFLFHNDIVTHIILYNWLYEMV